MKEEIEVQILKVEAYEEKINGVIKPIEVDTIDGRINFLVQVLENYKQQLEAMDEEGEEEEAEEENDQLSDDDSRETPLQIDH